MQSSLEEYIKKLESKKIKEVDFKFELVFLEIKRKMINYQMEDFVLIEKLLNYYKILRKYRYSQISEENERDIYNLEVVDQLYRDIVESGSYHQYLNHSFLLHYPKSENSLYWLELQFVSFIKKQEETIDIDEYYNILYALSYLSNFINEKTIYIAHNILLFYKDILNRKEYLSYDEKVPIDNLYASLVNQNSQYQKYKR